MELNQLYFEDCRTGIVRVPEASIDMILTDFPHGNTANAWDKVLPMNDFVQMDKRRLSKEEYILHLAFHGFTPKLAEEHWQRDHQKGLWYHFERVIKPNGAIVLFTQGMFTHQLAASNPALYRYDLVWKKGEQISGFLDAKRKPLRNHEWILVFYKSQPTYNPQMVEGKKANSRGRGGGVTTKNYGQFVHVSGETPNGKLKYPKSVLLYPRPHPAIFPTQKPVPLLENLIRTYTNPGEVVLDTCAGSGQTVIACINTGNRYIAFENNQSNYELAQTEINKHIQKQKDSTGQ